MYNGIGPDIHDKAWTDYEKIQWPNLRNMSHRIRSTLSRVLGVVKSFLDPSQFD